MSNGGKCKKMLVVDKGEFEGRESEKELWITEGSKGCHRRRVQRTVSKVLGGKRR